MKKAKKILAAAMVLLAASSFVFTSCDPEVPENNNTEQTGGDNTSGESTDKDSGSTDETPATKEYTVTFDKADGSESPKSTAKVKDGEKAEKPADPTKTGYTFAGWFAKDAAEAFDFESTISADTTLTAKWTVVEYTITYTLGEGETNAETNPAKYTIESDDITLAAPTGTTAKPNFVAWHKDKADGETVTSIKKGSTGNLTLVAEFTDKATYEVKYVFGDKELEKVKVAEGGKLENKTIAQDGYDFEGWYSDKELKNKIDFTKNPTVSAATTVYGKYTKQVTYKVTVDGTEQTVKSGDKAKKPADPTKEGKKFLGWYVGDTAYDFETPVTKDLVITAKWEDVETIPTYTLIPVEDSPFVIKYSDGEYCEIKGILPDATNYKKGDKFKIVVKGKADKAITDFRVVIADCAADTGDGYDYNVIAEVNFDDAASIAAHTDFEKSVEVTITKDQIGGKKAETAADAHRIRLYCGDDETKDTIKIYPQGTDTVAKLAADIAAEEAAAAEGNLLSSAVIIKWDTTCKVDADKFAEATTGSKIKVTLNVTNTEALSMKWHNGDWSPLFGGGTFEGAKIAFDETNADNDHVIKPEPVPSDATTDCVITYTPTEEEWGKIKEDDKGFVISGDGAKVTKIQLVK